MAAETKLWLGVKEINARTINFFIIKSIDILSIDVPAGEVYNTEGQRVCTEQ